MSHASQAASQVRTLECIDVLDGQRGTAELHDQPKGKPAGLSQAFCVSVTTACSAQLGRSAAQLLGIAGHRAHKCSQGPVRTNALSLPGSFNVSMSIRPLHRLFPCSDANEVLPIHNMQCCLCRRQPH